MNRKIKLLTLIIMSMSVYFIYNITKNNTINIVSLGDFLTEGITSYGIKDYSYSDYLKLDLESNSIKINLNKYSNKDMSIDKLLTLIKTTPKIKKDLKEAHILILNIGYNDLLYKLSITEDISIYKLNKIILDIENDYNELIKEIKKYYDNKIIVVGYYKTNSNDFYQNRGISMLNKVLNNENIIYIDTYNLDKKYFNNPNSYYPNNYGYLEIAKKIIKKLENMKNI